jgi:cobalt-zinc-cadmium efflux system protein
MPKGNMEKVSESKKRLKVALAITLLFMVMEIVAGFWSGSLALLADAGHMLTDAGALALSLLVFWLSEKPATPKRTFGYRRTEILAALANGLTLWVTVGIIAHEAYHRFQNPPDLLVGPMFWVAIAGLIANLLSAWILKPTDEHSHNLNMKGAYLHVLTDSLGSVGVVVAAIIVLTTGYARADALVSIFICGLILFSSWGLMKESITILLEATPSHLNVREIEKALLGIGGVSDLHDLHVWTVTSGFDLLSGHLVIKDMAMNQEILEQARDILRSKFGIDHSTIQIEKETEPLSE